MFANMHEFLQLLRLPKEDVGILTVVAVVVHQDDFFKQVCRRVIDS